MISASHLFFTPERVTSVKTPISHYAADDTLFLAGHTAPAGTYQMLDSKREVRQEQEDTLPASCDGQITVYRQMPCSQGAITSRSEPQADQPQFCAITAGRLA